MKITDPILQHAIDRLRDHAGNSDGIVEIEPIQYGVKLTLHLMGQSVGGALYHSKKKRKFSFVPNGKGESEASALLEELVAKATGNTAATSNRRQGNHTTVSTVFSWESLPAFEQKLKCWIGTDEAGKGDTFGPLVVGGFVADRETAETLVAMGVRDSKQLAISQVRAIADKLYEEFEDRIAVVELDPAWYNSEYSTFKPKGGINGLLGWAHANAIAELENRHSGIDAAVVDRFGDQKRIIPYLDPAVKHVPLLLRPEAESNPAVAAGAILARDRFEHALDRMEERIGWRPHAGSGSPAVKDLKRLFRQSPNDLHRYVKMHFATVQALPLPTERSSGKN